MARTWDDLNIRIATAAVLVAVFAVAAGIGGPIFVGLVCLAGGGMIWELTRMLAPEQPRLGWLLGALALLWAFIFGQASFVTGLAALIVAPVVGWALIPRRKGTYALYSTAIILSVVSFAVIRLGFGLTVLLWLIAVVAASDIAGYFAGRALGGPKFWPAISPKKTWTGTIAGWIAALLVGVLFAVFADWAPLAVALSAVLALAAQIGDLAESAVKRSVGVKDASNILPGHGGLLDRFDGQIGAVLAFMLIVVPIDAVWHILP